MESTQKIYAKLNYDLEIKGVDDEGYHIIRSLVTSIDIFDEITVKERTDGEITLVYTNLRPQVDKVNDKAYIAVKAFAREFGEKGYDIIINKNIPVGGGLGGSSADIAGVIKCLKEINGLRDSDVLPLLESLGSDTVFMHLGGVAEISGRGNEIKKVRGEKRYFVLALPPFGVSAKRAYDLYDLNPVKKGNEKYFNALYNGVAEKFPLLKEVRRKLEESGAEGVSMTGSGSVMFAVYKNEEERNSAFSSLSVDGVKFIKAQSVEL